MVFTKAIIFKIKSAILGYTIRTSWYVPNIALYITFYLLSIFLIVNCTL